MSLPTNFSGETEGAPTGLDLGLIPKADVQGALVRAMQLRAQIIDRWNATYYYDQVSAQSREFLLKNANAFNKWYQKANAKQAKMDASFPVSAEQQTDWPGYKPGPPGIGGGTTLQEKASYYPAKVEKAAMRPTRYAAGQTPAERDLVRVAREMAIWGTQPTTKPRR